MIHPSILEVIPWTVRTPFRKFLPVPWTAKYLPCVFHINVLEISFQVIANIFQFSIYDLECIVPTVSVSVKNDGVHLCTEPRTGTHIEKTHTEQPAASLPRASLAAPGRSSLCEESSCAQPFCPVVFPRAV